MTEKSWEEKLWEREEQVREQVRRAFTDADYGAVVADLKADEELSSGDLEFLLDAAENEWWLMDVAEKMAEKELGGTREEQVERLLKAGEYLMRKVHGSYGVVKIERDNEGRFDEFASIDCDAFGNTLVAKSSKDDGFSHCVLDWFDTSDEAYTHLRKHLMEVLPLEKSDWQYCTPQFSIWGDSEDELDAEIDEAWWKRQGEAKHE